MQCSIYRHLEDLHCAYGTDSGMYNSASCHGNKTLESVLKTEGAGVSMNDGLIPCFGAMMRQHMGRERRWL